MNILVCIKRVPDVGSRIVLTEDCRTIETRNLGFTISPHEECALEEAICLTETIGGKGTVLTLGPPEAEEQLRDALAKGMERAVLMQTNGEEWGARSTAGAIVQFLQAEGDNGIEYDLLMFGQESADGNNGQVGIMVAHALNLPCVTGLKGLEIKDGTVISRRETKKGWAIYETPLPSVVTVKEGLNLPRHPSLRGTMTARKKKVDVFDPQRETDALITEELGHPQEESKEVVIIGEGPEAASGVVEMLRKLEVLK